MTVYFFYGDEDYLIDAQIESMRSKLNPDFLSMSFKIFDNPNYSDLISALRTPPMMFGESLYIIKSEKYFSAKKDSAEDEDDLKFSDSDLKDIEDALNNNPDALNIVFVVKLSREENKKIDTRRKIYKILSKFNTEEFQSYKTYQTKEIENWVIRQSKKKDIILNKDAISLLIELLGNDLRQFDIELDKLKLIAYPEKTVTAKMVEDIAISHHDLFNITNLIIKNKKDAALLEFKKLTDKKHPLEILAALQTMLRKWIIIKMKTGQISTFEISKLTELTENNVIKNIQNLKNTNTADLVRLKQNLYEAECRIKLKQSLDEVSEVEIALIR